MKLTERVIKMSQGFILGKPSFGVATLLAMGVMAMGTACGAAEKATTEALAHRWNFNGNAVDAVTGKETKTIGKPSLTSQCAVLPADRTARARSTSARARCRRARTA